MPANLKRALNEKKISIMGISEKTAWNKVNESTALTFVRQIASKLVGVIVALLTIAFIGLSAGGGLVMGIYLAIKLIEIWF